MDGTARGSRSAKKETAFYSLTSRDLTMTGNMLIWKRANISVLSKGVEIVLLV